MKYLFPKGSDGWFLLQMLFSASILYFPFALLLQEYNPIHWALGYRIVLVVVYALSWLWLSYRLISEQDNEQ